MDGREDTLAVAGNRAKVGPPTSLALIREIPEEEFWLANQKADRTRQAYRQDVADFIREIRIASVEELRQIDHRAVITWRRRLEERGESPWTIRRRLSGLSSLFRHLVEMGFAEKNPVRDVKRPEVNRNDGKTASFSPDQVRKILDAPDPTKLLGLRDRAILSVGFQVGARRAEIARLKVEDFRMTEGYPALYFHRKRNRDGFVTIHPEATQRIHAYLEAARHEDHVDGPLFRPVRSNQKAADARRPLAPDGIDRILRTYARKALGITRGFSAHSMRATFITTALENGAALEDVQYAAGHAHSSTTLLYDRRAQKPERSASFFANY